MDLSGFYCIRIPWQEPQRIEVRKIGDTYVFAFQDLFQRRIFVEGKQENFGVAMFQSRDLFRLTKFTVKGCWEEATYRDWRGRLHTLEIKKD